MFGRMDRDKDAMKSNQMSIQHRNRASEDEQKINKKRY